MRFLVVDFGVEPLASLDSSAARYEFKTMKRLKTLAKMGLNITHAATAKVTPTPSQ